MADTRIRGTYDEHDVHTPHAPVCIEPSESSETAIMKSLTVENDVHGYLVAEARRREETVSHLLRRRLAIPRRGISNGGSRPPKTKKADPRGRKLAACLKKISRGEAIWWRYVRILHCLYLLNPNEFADKARNIQGPVRKYFSEDREGMTKPSNIGTSESPYWAERHFSAGDTVKRLRDVMRSLGYSARMIQQAMDKLG